MASLIPSSRLISLTGTRFLLLNWCHYLASCKSFLHLYLKFKCNIFTLNSNLKWLNLGEAYTITKQLLGKFLPANLLGDNNWENTNFMNSLLDESFDIAHEYFAHADELVKTNKNKSNTFEDYHNFKEPCILILHLCGNYFRKTIKL